MQPFISGLAILLITMHWVRPGRVVAQIDLFPNLHPFVLLAKSLLPWGIFLDGNGSYQSPALTSFYLVTGILNHLATPSGGQALFAWITVFAGWLGAWRLARALGIAVPAATFAAWAYVLAPYGLFYMLVFTTATVLFSVLPWLFLIILRIAQNPLGVRFYRLIAIILSFAFIPVIAGTPQLLFELLLCTAFIIYFVWIYIKPPRAYFTNIASTFVLAAIAGAWWSIPIAIAFLSNRITHATNPADNSFVFRNSSLLNNFRFVTAWSWPLSDYYPLSHAIDHNVILYGSQYLLAFLAIASLIIVRGERLALVRLFLAALLVVFFLTKGLHPPFAGANQAIYSLPLLFMLQEPAGLVIFAILGAALSAGLALDSVYQKYSHLTWPTTIAAIFIMGIGCFPLLFGSVFHGRTRNLPSMLVKPSREWYNTAHYLKRHDPSAVVLLAPMNSSYQADYRWGYRGVDIVAAEMLPNPIFPPGVPLTYVQKRESKYVNFFIYSLLINGDPYAVEALRILNIRYVLYRGDIRGGTDLPTLAQLFMALPGASIHKFGNLVLFSLHSSSPLREPSKWYHLQLPSGSTAEKLNLTLAGATYLGLPLITNEGVSSDRFATQRPPCKLTSYWAPSTCRLLVLKPDGEGVQHFAARTTLRVSGRLSNVTPTVIKSGVFALLHGELLSSRAERILLSSDFPPYDTSSFSVAFAPGAPSVKRYSVAFFNPLDSDIVTSIVFKTRERNQSPPFVVFHNLTSASAFFLFSHSPGTVTKLGVLSAAGSSFSTPRRATCPAACATSFTATGVLLHHGINIVSIANSRKRLFHLIDLRSVRLVGQVAPHLVGPAASIQGYFTRTLHLNIPGAFAPRVRVVPLALGQEFTIIGLLSIKLGSTSYLCEGRLLPYRSVNLLHLIGNCLETNGITRGPGDAFIKAVTLLALPSPLAGRTPVLTLTKLAITFTARPPIDLQVHRLGSHTVGWRPLVEDARFGGRSLSARMGPTEGLGSLNPASRRQGNRTAGSLPWRTPSRIPGDLDYHEYFNGAVYSVRLKGHGPHLIVLSQYFDRGWFAVKLLGSLSAAPRHVRIDDALNGWLVQGSGVFLIFNLVNAFEVILFAASLLTVLLVARRATHH